MESSLFFRVLFLVLILAQLVMVIYTWIMIRRVSRRLRNTVECPSGEAEINKRRSGTLWNNPRPQPKSRGKPQDQTCSVGISKALSALGLGKKDKDKDEHRPIIVTHTLP